MLTRLLEISDWLRHRARLRRETLSGSGGTTAAGRRGEDLAHRYLQRAGLCIVARNWRSRSGQNELDLVADDGGTLVFVEVKARESAEWGAPDRAIDAEKHRRMVRAAREYIHRAGRDDSRVRFDTVSVILSRPPQIEHARDALRVPWRVPAPAVPADFGPQPPA